MRALLVTMVLLLAGCAAPDAVPSAPTPGAGSEEATAWAWTPRADAPVILAEAAVAAEGATMYVVGGWTQAGGGSPLALAYDADADAWRQLPPYPLAIHHAQAAVIDGTLYVFGGAVTGALFPGTFVGVGPAGWPLTDLAFRLDPGAQTWAAIAPLPSERGLGGAALVDGKVYIVGGVALDGYLARVDVYDPASDAYSEAAPLPTLRDHLSVVADGGRIHAIAGRSLASGSWDDLETHEALDVAADAWTSLAPAPLGRGGQGAGVLADGRIALVGGERAEGEFTVYDAAHAYDPATDAWVVLPSLPEARHGQPTAALGGILHIAGGGTLDGQILTSTLALEPAAEP